MTARILVVDDIPANVKLLEVRLLAEYFEVLTASNGAEAIDICEREKVDVVLLDVMMPGMNGFEVCSRLKANPETMRIPVVMVTALDQVTDRVRGLEAGADDFLTKPVNDIQLITRVKSLVRLKTLTDELHLRAATARNIGLEDFLAGKFDETRPLPKVLLIDERKSSSGRIRNMITDIAAVDIEVDPQAGFFSAVDGEYSCVVIATGFADYDPLRICSQLRSLDRTRFLPIVLIADPTEDSLVLRGLDLGINDYLVRPIDKQELIARLRTQIKRKHYNDELRANVTQTIELAVTDGLTGLHNRRYLDNHLQRLFDRAIARDRPLSIMIADIDRFKKINDTYGHDGGDDVLQQFAQRLRKNVRGIDLACRYGGEEFVIVMPDTSPSVAHTVAERIRYEVESVPFTVSGGSRKITVTASAGVATLNSGISGVSDLLKEADKALYEAKATGRNRVVAHAA
jgi:two-component system cell cycle response regulator